MTVLSAFDFGSVRGHNRYDWAKWTNGEIYKLVKGKDYHVKYMAAQIRVHAKQNALSVRVTCYHENAKGVKCSPSDAGAVEVVVFQFANPNAPAPKAKGARRSAAAKSNAAVSA